MRLRFWLKLLLQGSAPILTLIVVLLAIQPSLGYFNFHLTKLFFDSLNKGSSMQSAFWIACWLGGIKIAVISLNQIQAFFDDKLSLRVKYGLDKYLFGMVNPYTITRIETPEFTNEVNLLQNSMMNTKHLIGSCIRLIHHCIYFVVYGLLIIQYSWIVFVLLLMISAPAFVNEIIRAWKLEEHYRQVSQVQFESQNMANMIVRPQALKEMLIFASKRFLFNKWSKAAMKEMKQTIAYKKKEFVSKWLIALINPIGFLAIQFMLIRDLFNHSLSIGEYIALTTTLALVESSLNIMSYNTGVFKSISILNARISRFQSQYGSKPEQALLPVNKLRNIRLKEVVFRYPGTDKPILNRISLHISLGEVVVFVGENGSGKSTLAKLILGLHEVAPDQLFYDEKDVTQIDRNQIYQEVSIVDQNYMRYPFSVNDNISLTDNSRKVEQELNQFIKEYPYLVPANLQNGLDSILGIDYLNSTQLSGGQWQRVAIARALFKPCSFLLLDEATSELDPETEVKVMKHIIANRRGLTTIIVTHQLFLSTLADQIYVLQDGEIAERGTHQSLMEQKQLYFKMWMKQGELKEDADCELKQISGAV